MLQVDGNGGDINDILGELDDGERVTETNSKGIPIELITVLEGVRTQLEEIEADKVFNFNNPAQLAQAINKKIELIIGLPTRLSNIFYRMKKGKTKDIVSKMIVRYAEKADMVEMIGTKQERNDFFINPNGFGFEFDRLISILKDD